MISLIITSLLLGVALAMDACAASMANGLNEPKMKLKKICLIAFTFAFFQAIMPLIGFFVGHIFIDYIEKFIPWIALILLSFLGIKQIVECIREKDDSNDHDNKALTFKILLLQGIATSIDALSVGLTISDYSVKNAIICVIIIAIVTFIISVIGIFIGRKFGDWLGKKAEILGAIILIGIGLEIFISGMIK